MYFTPHPFFSLLQCDRATNGAEIRKYAQYVAPISYASM